MAEKLKNIVEGVVADFLNSSLALRYDICTCNLCKNAMLAEVLSNIPAKYVTTEEASMRAVIKQTRLEYQAKIAKAVLAAIEKISKNPQHELKEDREQAFKLLLNKIYEDRGLDFRHYRQEVLKRRLALRMRLNKAESYAEYFRLLIKKPEEYEKLFEILCINVSEFFRDPEVWIALKGILENIIRDKIQNNNSSLRIWSAGCANGEEPYSIAILVKEIGKNYDMNKLTVEILATDIDKRALKIAECAEYIRESLKNVSDERLKEFFTPLNGKYRVSQEIKDTVQFQYLDLISSEPMAEDIDIVLCRNVFIYLNRSLQDRLFTKLYKSLKPAGYLVIGRVETMWGEVREIFEEVEAHARIFRKKQ
jgi:chemotaxis methyl-accepting protein methylase